MNIDKVLVIGAGSWGSAIAHLISKNCSEVLLISNSKQSASDINSTHENKKHLPSIMLSDNIKASHMEKIHDGYELAFIVLPSCAVFDFSHTIRTIFPSLKGVILCSKGMIINGSPTPKFFSQYFAQNFPQLSYASVLGPTFALEVAKGLPTVATVASSDEFFIKSIRSLMESESFKLVQSSDVLTSEICGVAKNVIAIACGIIEALDFGSNTKSAVVVRGINEILNICRYFKTDSNLSTPSGFGDIFLTCSSSTSRNNSFGKDIVFGVDLGGRTVEGAIAAHHLSDFGIKAKVDLPLFDAVSKIISQRPHKDSIRSTIMEVLSKN